MNDGGIVYQMVFYKDGFFGYGPEGDFTQWSLAHFAPIVLTIVAIVLTWIFRERLRAWRHEDVARTLFVLAMIINSMSYYWRLLYVGPEFYGYGTFMDRLPLQICEWTLMVCSFMMLKKSAWLFDMTFFLTMSFSLLPLLFPAVISHTGPTYYRYYQFWLEHLLPIYGMYYMMFVHKMVPHPRGVILAMGMVWMLVPACIYLNQQFEAADYLYLKPGELEMISFLPSSLPVLIALYFVVLHLLMGLVWLIWKLVSKRLHISSADTTQ